MVAVQEPDNRPGADHWWRARDAPAASLRARTPTYRQVEVREVVRDDGRHGTSMVARWPRRGDTYDGTGVEHVAETDSRFTDPQRAVVLQLGSIPRERSNLARHRACRGHPDGAEVASNPVARTAARADDVDMDHCQHHGEPDGPEAGLARDGTWEATSSLDLPVAHEPGETVRIDRGTLLRCEHSLGGYDPRSHLETYVFRFFVLSGPSAGTCVLIETDGTANLSRAGLASRS